MSWLLDSSGKMESVCPESQGLEDDENDDDNDDEFSYPCHSTHTPPQCKSNNSSGETQVEDLGDPNPFSVNPRHSYMVKDEEVKNRIYAKKLAEHAQELEKEAQEFQEPLHKDVENPSSLSKDEDHSWTYHLPVHQRSHVLRTASVASCGSYDSFQCGGGKHLGMDAFAPWGRASDPYLGYPERTRSADPHMLHEEAIGDREFSSLQLTHDMLSEENTMLRRVVRSMQNSLETQACMMQKLEKQLQVTLDKGRREAQELQSFVEQKEWSLHVMSQRALEAEHNVEKLKQEIFILQEELESCKVENENLRAGQMTDLGAVKGNIDFALQSLHKIITGANWSIRQLTSGAESLHFVAEVLKSTGKISELEAETEL